MKKVFSLVALALLSVGLFSCDAETIADIADQEELYIDSPDVNSRDLDKRDQ